MSFEFAQPFDGTQPEVSLAEQQHVSASFASFVDNTLLTHIDKTFSIDPGPATKPDPTTRLKLISEEDSLSITVSSMPQNKYIQKEIFIQRVEGVYGGDAVAYRLSPDGVVRRCDLPKKTTEQKSIDRAAGLELMDEDINPTEALKRALDVRAAIVQDMQNAQLEQDLGLNNQPIGINEFSSLLQIVESAEVK